MVGNARGDRCLMDDPTTAPGEQHKTELLLLLTKLISEQAGKQARKHLFVLTSPGMTLRRGIYLLLMM